MSLELGPKWKKILIFIFLLNKILGEIFSKKIFIIGVGTKRKFFHWKLLDNI